MRKQKKVALAKKLTPAGQIRKLKAQVADEKKVKETWFNVSQQLENELDVANIKNVDLRDRVAALEEEISRINNENIEMAATIAFMEEEASEEAKIIGAGGQRELKLITAVQRLEKELAEARLPWYKKLWK